MRPRVLAFLVVLPLVMGLAEARPQVPGLVNARGEARTVSGPLKREVEALLAANPGPFWMGYAVPTTREHSMCCGNSGRDEDGCGGCRLEESDRGSGFRTSGPATVRLATNRSLRVLLRGERGLITRLTAVSEDCTLDAGGLRVIWLDGVSASDSVAFLEGLASTWSTNGEGRRDQDVALMALAHTDDPASDRALEHFLEPARPQDLRKKAAFWLGVSGRPGAVARLSLLATKDADPKMREHAVFALSQSKDKAAVETIVELAKRDPDAHVRGQALFWLAQTASRQAASVIEAAATQDPEVEVKKKAVFALSQLPREQGVPLLVKLARTHPSVEVRKQAMFWLGQSGDPRALAFFEEVLKP
jgi:hypothetical protein